MAIKVETTVKVQDISEFSWGIVARCSHAHRAKNDSGEWETKSYTNVDVVLPSDAVVQKGDRIKVEGYVSAVAAYNKKDGSLGSTMRVNADSVIVDNFESNTPSPLEENVPF